MSLPTLDEVVVDQRKTWLARAMAECPVCELHPEYHERIREARQRQWGQVKIHSFLAAVGAKVTVTNVKSHLGTHLDEEGLCLRSDRRPSQGSTSSSERRRRAKSPSITKKMAG